MSRWRIGHSAVRPHEDPDRVYRKEGDLFGPGLSAGSKKRGKRRGRNGFTAGAAKRAQTSRAGRNGFTAGARRRGR